MLRRRNLLKRVLPILLSLAMMLQSVPMTAMAAELPVAATAEEADAATEPAEETEAVVEPTEETEAAVESTEDADAAESAAQPEEDATVADDAAAEDGVQADETAENTEEQPDAVTEEDGAKSDDAAEDSESKPETVKKPVAETETEVAANGVVKEGVAKIIVKDTEVWDWIGDDDEPGGITRKLGETDLVFFAEYVDPEMSKVGKLQNNVKDWLDIEVDGEPVNNLRDSLTYSWVKKSEVEGGADVPLVDAMPVDAGTYELTIALDVTGTNGLCTKVEPEGGVKLTLTIEKAKINIWPDGGTLTQPGKTVGDLLDKLNEDYRIVYEGRDEGGPRYIVSRDIINTADKKLPAHVYVIENGTRQDLTETPELLKTKFDSTKDYILTIEPKAESEAETKPNLLTSNAAANYELYLEDFWKIDVGERQDTSIKFERKDPGKDLIAVYGEKDSYPITDVTGEQPADPFKDLFMPEEKDADGKVTKTGAPAVYIRDDKLEKDVILEDVEPVANWYTRIKLNAGENYTLDEDADEFRVRIGEENYIYKPMTTDPADAGEYYIIWTYAGDEGAYQKSDSSEDAIRFTIEPAPVVINIDVNESDKTDKGAKLGFADGMTADDVKKTLAKIAYGVYPINQETGALDTTSVATPDFFGTSYGIIDYTGNKGDIVEADWTNNGRTQYFVPEFVLQRRPVKMTEKGGGEITVDEKTVDWNPTDTLDVVIDNENKKFASIGSELPQDVKDSYKKTIESVEFAYRVYFTGNKVVYDKNGEKISFNYKFEDGTVKWVNAIPVTDVTTNAANKNYLADITKARLEASAVELEVATAEDVTIDTEAIVKAFADYNSDMLYPQPGADVEATDIHKGTLADPATKIYDLNGLFKNRAAYKLAEVRKLDENGAPGDTTGIKGTDKKLAYDWGYISLYRYEEYLEKWDDVQRQYKDFDEYYYTWEWKGMTDPEDGSLINPKSVGVYRLSVKFEDTDREYKSAEAEVFFKVEQQEVIVVPTTTQLVGKGDDIYGFEERLPGKLENRNDYIIYKLPLNEKGDGFISDDDFNNLSDEVKKTYEITPEEALASYETENGKKYAANIVQDWKVLRKEKDTVGQDTNVWVKATGSFEDDFAYGIAANWTGDLNGLDGEVSGDNYTTKDVKTYRTTGEEKHHESVGDVKLYDGMIYVEVDREKVEALGHEYNGEPVSLEDVADALTFYTDEELKTKLTEDSKTVLNMDPEKYDPAKINIYWEKNGYKYANRNAVYGGEYTLVLRFEGGALTTTSEAAPQDDAAEATGPIYAPIGITDEWLRVYDYNTDENYTFTVTPRALTITPKLLSEDILKAGDSANELVTGVLLFGVRDKEGNIIPDEDGNPVGDILPKDEKFFSYVELAKGGFDAGYAGKNTDGTDKESAAYTYDIDKNGGYPAFCYDNGYWEYDEDVEDIVWVPGESCDGSAEYSYQIDDKDLGWNGDDVVYLRCGKTYTVKLKNGLATPLAESYRVTYAPASVTINQRGNAEIDEIAKKLDLSTGRIEYSFSDSTYTVMPRGAVKFYDNNEPINALGREGEIKELKNTNILGFRIYAPKEFWTDNDFIDWDKGGNSLRKDKFVYQNAIWNAGGYFYDNYDYDENNELIIKDWEADDKGYYIDVVFPLAKGDVDRSFDITWENGYKETFKWVEKDVALEEDLTKAVAPKSIKFNGVATKMAVGERQQLNLKITKAQLGDVIAVRYRIKGSEETKNARISLDPETGVVTALRADKTPTQIEAYAVYKDAKGNFVPVVDSKGKEKVATTKITVTEVTASAIKKIVAQGNSAKLYYTVPDNGYRREVYVVDVTKGIGNEAAKKWKPAKFNEEIANIKNGQWKDAGFAIEPIYSYAKNERLYEKEVAGTYDSKLKAHILTIGGLEAEHEYMVYVRNVSAARALDDGSVVVLSANGAVKKTKTTKSQVKRLDLDFTIKTGEKGDKNTVTHPVREDGTVNTGAWTVELSAKKAQLNVYGIFSDLTNYAVEENDERKYPLVPTSKEKDVKDALLNKYQQPKLEYVILDETSGTPFDPAQKQSKYATINKKGLISLKGVDLNGEATVYIYVRDNTQHQGQKDYGFTPAGDMIPLTITAKATSVTGKKVKAVVGQSIRLADCLTYKDGKKTLPNYRSGNIQITPEMKNAAKVVGYDIVDRDEWDGKNNRTVHNWYITALWPNKNKFELKVTAFDVLDGNGNPVVATIPLTSKQMDPVKGLKVTYVDDKNITINFTHAANKNEADNGNVYQYAFEIKDARGNVVEKKILSNPTPVTNCDIANAKELKSAQSWIQYDTTTVSTDKLKDNTIQVSDSRNKQFNYYTGTKAKTKTFAYTYRFPNDMTNKLVRLSSYTISVTPLYKNQKADKAATTKTKTTNIPASYENPDLTGAAPGRLGGTGVEITATDNRQMYKNNNNVAVKWEKIYKESAYPFVSGNTYTLKINEADNNDVPRDRVSDTLTWKSSNTKVASIKANAGTYTATFKPVNQGETTITVTSKITKKVIARHAVKVVAVRDGAGYGGDYEPTWPNGFYEKILALYDPYYDGVVEVLSMNVPLNVDEDTWVSFTAPHYGEYTFSYSGRFYDSRDGKEIVGGDSNKLFLEEGQKVYFKTSGIVTVTGTELARLTQANKEDNPLEVKAGYAAFTAWEDNVYTFWLNGKKLNEFAGIEGFVDKGMSAGQTEYVPVPEDGKMYVTWRDLGTPVALDTPIPVELNWETQEKYVTYIANVAGEYTFKYVIPEGVECNISNANDDELNSVSETSTTNEKDKTEEVTKSYYLDAGQKVVVEFKAEPVITDKAKKLTATVTVSAAKREKVKEDGTITIKKGTTEIVEYVIPAFFNPEKAQFKFKVENGSIKQYLNKDYKNLAEIELEDWMEKDGITKALNKDAGILTASKKNYPEFKSGDSIYVEIEADSTDEDAVLKVTQVKVDKLEVGSKPLDITDDTDQWYTFTAPKDGFYEFGVTVAERAAGDETPTHEDAGLKLYKELFVEEKEIEETILDMKSGEMLALKLNYTKLDVTDANGEKVDVKSPANVSVEQLDITPLALGKENAKQVDLPTLDGKETHYYSFTATVDAKYTFAWQYADEKQQNAEVTGLSAIVNSKTGQDLLEGDWQPTMKAGEVRYIKVKVADPDAGIAVSGTLCVTADDLKAEALKEGTASKYDLKDKDGERVKVFKFTAPETGNYAIVTTVDPDPDTGLAYNYPSISYTYINRKSEVTKTVSGEETAYHVILGRNERSDSLNKGETKYFTLELNGATATAGTIMIRSVAAEAAADQEVTVTKNDVKQYTFKIPESGRYEFKADYDENKADVTIGGSPLRDVNGRYYLKNKEVTISVKGLDPEEEASVKLYQPTMVALQPALNIGEDKENQIKVEAGKANYYEISVTDPATYELKVTDIEGTANSKVQYAINNDRLIDLNINNVETSIPVPKNGKLFIKISASDPKKELNCNLIVKQRRELNVGDNEVTLKAGKTTFLIFRAPETNYYSFRVNHPGAELVFGDKTGDSFYSICHLDVEYDPWSTVTYTLRNEGAADVTLNVKIDAVTPIAVTSDSKPVEFKIPAGEVAYYALKTFKKDTDYLVKIADTSSADLEAELDTNYIDAEYSQKKTADSITWNLKMPEYESGETFLTIKNVGIKETSGTIELTVDKAEALPADGMITLKKGESKLIKYVAAEDNRYQISKDNDDVTMTLVNKWDTSDLDLWNVNHQPESQNTEVDKYTEEILCRADKLVYELSYPDTDDEKAPATKTVKVTIAPIDRDEIKAESTKVEIKENDSTSVWYWFKANDDAVYTFSLEDAYENEVPGKMNFYAYMTAEGSDENVERYMKKGQKVFINLSGLEEGSTYTLKYEAVKAITDIDGNTKGTYTLDFNYPNEVQKLKFVVPKGGTYKVSAAAFRGEFKVEGERGEGDNVLNFETANGRGFDTTASLAADDIVTFSVTALSEGKSSVTIRIAEDSVANSLTEGKAEPGVSSKVKDIYYEIRVAETAFYAISAAGAPDVYYAVNGSDESKVNGVEYVSLEKEDRVVIKVEQNDLEAAYTVKIAKVSATSLDGNDTQEKALSAVTGENDYEFNGKEAYITLKASKAGDYYIAFEPIPVAYTDEDGDVRENLALIDPARYNSADMVTLAQDQEVNFKFTNPAVEEDTDKTLAAAMFRLTIRPALDAAENPITVGVPKEGTLAAKESVTYQFKATEKAEYAIDFEKSNCNLEVKDKDGSLIDYDEPKLLEVDDVLTLKVTGNPNPNAGKYKLTVTKVAPVELKLGEKTPEIELKPKKSAYYVFASTVTADDGEAKYLVYGSGLADGIAKGEIVDKDGNFKDYLYPANCRAEVTLVKGDKLKITLTNNSTMNKGFNLTVKEVKAATIAEANKAVEGPGPLDAYEKAYYEFTATKKGDYQVSLDEAATKKGMTTVVFSEKFVGEGEDRKLEKKEEVDPGDSAALDIGEKLQITLVASEKAGTYKLTVEDVTEPEIKPTAISLGEKQPGRLYGKEIAKYEFTASAKDTYSVYFNGDKDAEGDPLVECKYTLTTTKSDADGKSTTETSDPISLTLGNVTSISCEENDKITFTVSGKGNYELTVKAVAIEQPPLTLGKKVSKTLKPGETVYYQFTSADTPAAGEETTKYQVYGTNGVYDSFIDGYDYTIMARKLTLDEDGKVTDPGLDSDDWMEVWLPYEAELKEKEILQFRYRRIVTDQLPSS